MSTILAIDQGTTSTKAYLARSDGSFSFVGRHVHRQFRPRPGWVEQDPVELLRGLQELAAQAGMCDGAGLANQGETVVAWDARTRQPLHHAIVWQDDRTRHAVEALRSKGVEALTLSRAGLPLDPYFAASKLRWLLDNADGAAGLHRAGRLRLGTSDAFFLDAMTGRCATDVATASRTSLLDLRTLQWDPDLCAAFGVPMECLPELRPSVGWIGALQGCGPADGAPVLASIVDQQASLFGHGCRVPGDIKITFGTGAFALGLSGEALRIPDAPGLIATCAWQIGDAAPWYALDGGIFTAGSALDWLVETGLLEDIETAGRFVGPSAASRGLMFVPGLAGLGCPYWDRSARGMWIGLGLDTSREDLCRAVIEGIALRAAQLVGSFTEALGEVRRISIDGGLSRSDYFLQFMADAIGAPIEVAACADLTALGVALLCAEATGEKLCDATADGLRFRRVIPTTPLDDTVHRRFADAVERSRGWELPS
jgi:glycerol kinase